MIDHPTAELDALRKRAQEKILAVRYPLEARPPRDWRMPRPPQPVGQFNDGVSPVWHSREDYGAVILPNMRLRVLEGGGSDGASIPWFLQTAFTPRFDKATFAQAWVHDHLYAARLVSRSMADWIFYQQLLAGGVHPTKARAYYLAVYTCGWRTWQKHTALSVAEARQYARIEVLEEAV